MLSRVGNAEAIRDDVEERYGRQRFAALSVAIAHEEGGLVSAGREVVVQQPESSALPPARLPRLPPAWCC